MPVTKPRLHLIAAVTRDGGIGNGSELLVRLPEDLQRFKRMTMGHPVIMGRRTWESLPPVFRPLPGRQNIVVTRQAGYTAERATVAHSLSQAIATAGDAPDVYVIGGAQLYAEALPLADQLDLTEIDATFPADVFFPDWDRRAWAETDRETHLSPADRGHGWSYHWVTYRRRRA